jgi:hypothetical protein
MGWSSEEISLAKQANDQEKCADGYFKNTAPPGRGQIAAAVIVYLLICSLWGGSSFRDPPLLVCAR